MTPQEHVFHCIKRNLLAMQLWRQTEIFSKEV
jgi:hypothetical protein